MRDWPQADNPRFKREVRQSGRHSKPANSAQRAAHSWGKSMATKKQDKPKTEKPKPESTRPLPIIETRK